MKSSVYLAALLAVASQSLATPVPYDILQHPLDDDVSHTAPFLHHLSSAEDQVLHIVHPDGTTHPMNFAHVTLMHSPSGDAGTGHHPAMMVPHGMLPHKANSTAEDEDHEEDEVHPSSHVNASAQATHIIVAGLPFSALTSPSSSSSSSNKSANVHQPLNASATVHSDNGTAVHLDHAPEKLAELKANPAPAPQANTTASPTHAPEQAPVHVESGKNATEPAKKIEDPDVGKTNSTIISQPPTSAEPEHKNAADNLPSRIGFTLTSLALAAACAVAFM